jgi:hypothetical protein
VGDQDGAALAKVLVSGGAHEGVPAEKEMANVEESGDQGICERFFGKRKMEQENKIWRGVLAAWECVSWAGVYYKPRALIQTEMFLFLFL